MKYAIKSDKGLVREINEDRGSVVEGCNGVPYVFIIADGMGGHNSGEIASKMAVDFVSDYVTQFPEVLLSEEKILEGIEEMVCKANASIYTKAGEHLSNYGMGTTFIVAVPLKDKMYVGHVGDSRLYLIRDGEIRRITTDHSYIEELIKNGSLTREEAENHPRKNIITRALGCSEDIEVDTYFFGIVKNDYYVLCTDGLTNMLGENEIKEIVLNSVSPEAACDELIRRANENGGEDNVTAIVVKNDC